MDGGHIRCRNLIPETVVSNCMVRLGNKSTLVMVRERSFRDLADMFIKNVSLLSSLYTIVFILRVEAKSAS